MVILELNVDVFPLLAMFIVFVHIKKVSCNCVWMLLCLQQHHSSITRVRRTMWYEHVFGWAKFRQLLCDKVPESLPGQVDML